MENTRRFFAAAIVLAVVCLLPAGATAHGDAHRQPDPGGALVWPEDIQAQNTVFPGHDGHIMPPSPEDWARYHAAEARVQEARPVFPYRSHRGGHKRHKR